MSNFSVRAIGVLRSDLKRREEAPRQGPEGAPDAWLEIEPQFAEALLGMEVGHELIVITGYTRRGAMFSRGIRAAMRAVRSPACFTRAHLRDRTRSGCIP
jgi:tRNA (Thr-GGU) A37 N-methylase